MDKGMRICVCVCVKREMWQKENEEKRTVRIETDMKTNTYLFFVSPSSSLRTQYPNAPTHRDRHKDRTRHRQKDI